MGEHAALDQGDYVALVVADTGSGIAADVFPHIFEPFFTTKRSARAPGFGLSMVEGIVQQSGGATIVESRLGQGTTFTIYLPQGAAGALEAPAVAESAAPDSGTFETVLVCDDDDDVRQLVVGILGLRAYRLLQAGNGRSALEIATSHGGPIHLLVTDVAMPEMGGIELATELRKRYPGMRVLYVSGYTENADLLSAPLGPDTHFLPKPFLPARSHPRGHRNTRAPANHVARGPLPGALADDLDVEVTGLGRAPQPQPQKQIALRPASGGDVAEIDHALPAERAEDLFHAPFGARVVAAHEDIVVAASDSCGVDHDLTVHGVERLDHLRLRKRALNLLAERIGVSRKERGRPSLGKVERVGDIDEDFAPEVTLTSRSNGVERAFARSAVEDQFAEGCRIGKGPVRRVRSRTLRPGGGLFVLGVSRSEADSCPSATSLPPIACPTIPVPRTPIFMAILLLGKVEPRLLASRGQPPRPSQNRRRPAASLG